MPRLVWQMLDSDGNIGIKLCLMMEVLAAPSVKSAIAQPIIKSHGQFFLRGTNPRQQIPLFWPSVSRIDRIAPDFRKSPHIHQRHSLTFRCAQRLVLQCSTSVDIFSCSYTLCIRLITCQSLLIPNTSTPLLESHPFPWSLLSSFVITLLFSTSFLPIRCNKHSFGTPSGSNLWFSPFSSLSKYPLHLPKILSRSLKSTRCSSIIWLFLVKSLAFAIRDIFLSHSGVSSSSYNSFIARALAVLLLSLPPCLPSLFACL